jgi:hypothetical protein
MMPVRGMQPALRLTPRWTLRDDRIARAKRLRKQLARARLRDEEEISPDLRSTWAEAIGTLLEEIEQPQPLIRSIRLLYRPDIALACAGSLAKIRAVLVDCSVAVAPGPMRRLRAFLADAARSPLYGYDLEQARQSAHELELAFCLNATDLHTL